MRTPQYIAVAITALLLAVTYWGCPVRPPEMEEGFQRGPLAATGLESLVREARSKLTPAQMATLSTLDDRLESQTDPEEQLDLLEQMAGEWYKAGQPAISGIYAAQIAEQRNTEEAWSIAATTFSLCIRQEEQPEKTRDFCRQQSEQAYQSAISLNPENIEHRINLALTYTDSPNPMQGISMLRDLSERYPEEPKVFITLAQLAIRTNQLDRAAERLERAVELAPNNIDAVCNLAKVYEAIAEPEKSATFAARCGQLVTAAEN